MAKRVPPLTSTQVAKARPDPAKVIELVDGAVPGLRLRITPAGTRSWSLNMRSAGRMRRFDVGQNLGLADARRSAEDLRRRIQKGEDPTAERRALRARSKDADEGRGTFETVVDAYFSQGPGSSLKSKVEQVRRIRSVFDSELKRPALELNAVNLQLAIDAYSSKSAAARAAAYLSPVLKWAARRGLITDAFDLEKPHIDIDPDAGPGQGTLSEDELRKLLPHLTDAHGLCCQFILLTGARREEAAGATWEEIDWEERTWTIAASRRKDTRTRTRRKAVPAPPHVVPLSEQAIALLNQAKVTEQRRRALNDPLDTIDQADPVFVGERGGKLQNWDRSLKRIATSSGVSGWSAHTLRRTTATLAADLGAEPHIISVILGHKNVGGQLTATYSKSRYKSEHRKALQRVGNELDAMLSK